MTYMYEGAQSAHFHPHTVQGALCKLQARERETVSESTGETAAMDYMLQY